jgi:hypothetical protein
MVFDLKVGADLRCIIPETGFMYIGSCEALVAGELGAKKSPNNNISCYWGFKASIYPIKCLFYVPLCTFLWTHIVFANTSHLHWILHSVTTERVA